MSLLSQSRFFFWRIFTRAFYLGIGFVMLVYITGGIYSNTLDTVQQLVSQTNSGTTTETVLVPTRDIWKYLDTGLNLGNNWSTSNFNDAGWASGKAKLGYGNGDETTTVNFGSDPNNKYITSYFRHSFSVTDPANFTCLSVRLLRDDGAIVYLNGIELFRSNMPTGTIGYTTPSLTTVSGNDETTFFEYLLPVSILTSGQNVIAVEIHQSAPNSSDIGFDLELLGVVVAANLRFAVIGDFGLSGQPELDVSRLVKNWNPDLVVTTGDNNYPLGAADSIDTNIGQYYHDFIYPYTGSFGQGAVTNRFFPILGNHDWASGTLAPYLNYFNLPGNERYYEFVRGSVHFFMLDSDSGELDGVSSNSIQATWLRDHLAASTAPWKVVLLHHPPFSSGLAHGSQSLLQWPYQSWGASVIISGHEHNYERLTVDKLPYVVNGLGGHSLYAFNFLPLASSQVRYNADYGAMLVEANNGFLTFQFVNRTGQVIDHFELNQTPATPQALTASSTVTGQVDLTWTDKAINENGYWCSINN